MNPSPRSLLSPEESFESDESVDSSWGSKESIESGPVQGVCQFQSSPRSLSSPLGQRF
jgi:hypothetical protein